jgi:uncharacterized protein YvpB
MANFFNEMMFVVTKISFLKNYFMIVVFLFSFYNLIALLLEKNIIKKPQRWVNLSFLNNLKNILAIRFFKIFEKRLAINITFIIFFLLGIAAYFKPLPKVVYPKGPSLDFTDISYDNPLVIKFDRPLSKNKVAYDIVPKIEGEWDLGYKKISFKPSVTTKPEERYTVSLKEITSLFGGKGYDYSLSFKAPPAPLIKKASVSEGQEGILPTQEIVFESEPHNQKIAKFEFEIIPEIEIKVNSENFKHKISAIDGFKKGVFYEIRVFRTLVSFDYGKKAEIAVGQQEEVYKVSFKTIEAPGVKDYSPKGSGVLTNSFITVEFGQDMDTNSVLKNFITEPLINGQFLWEGNRILKFTPNDLLAKNTKYKISILKESLLTDGSALEDDFLFEFNTIGFVGVSSFFPTNNAKTVEKNTAIKVAFNQPVDKASAQANFLIIPAVDGAFLWEGEVLNFKPVELEFSKNYQIKIMPGVKSIYGLDSITEFSSNFTTKEQYIMLNVPAYKQTYLYSCMASASRSALAYRGVSVSEKTLLDLMGYDNTPWSGTWRDPSSIWGDPNKGVVGDLNGKADPGWGYGAHWGPTARAISNYRNTETKTGWNVQGIAQEIANGNPVLVWWVNGVWPAFEVNWKNNGTNIRAVNSMHVQVVKGFTGSVDNPTSFTVTDSGYYYPQQVFDTATFKAKWGWFGNTAVVVR